MDLSKPAEQRPKQAWDSKGTIPKTEPSFTTVENTQSTLCTMLQPLFFLVKLFGMNISDKRYYSSGYGRISVGYSVFTMLVLCLLSGWSMRHLRNVTSLDNLVMSAWLAMLPFLSTCQAIHTFCMCVSDNGWRRLFTKYQLTHKGIWPTESCSKMRQHTYIYILVCLVYMSTMIFFEAYFKVFSLHSFRSESVFLTYLEIFITFYQYAWLIIPTLLLSYVIHITTREFQLFNEKLEGLSQSSPLEVTRSIGEIRDMHKRLSDLTQAADSLFSAPTVMCIIFHFVMICSSLYSLIYVPLSLGKPIDMAAKIIWMIASFLLLFTTIGTCARLNEKVGIAYYLCTHE